jgi:hypothetical protein
MEPAVWSALSFGTGVRGVRVRVRGMFPGPFLKAARCHGDLTFTSPLLFPPLFSEITLIRP